MARALAAGHEGLMAKDPASPYEPGGRGKKWLKLKAALTVDCVIVAADRGSGRRVGWLSNYHLAVRDGDGWAEVGKTFKGLTDREFTEMTERLRGAGHRRRRLHGAGAAGGRGGGGLQRDPEEPDLPVRLRAALRPHRARPPRQGPRPGHHARGAALASTSASSRRRAGPSPRPPRTRAARSTAAPGTRRPVACGRISASRRARSKRFLTISKRSPSWRRRIS